MKENAAAEKKAPPRRDTPAVMIGRQRLRNHVFHVANNPAKDRAYDPILNKLQTQPETGSPGRRWLAARRPRALKATDGLRLPGRFDVEPRRRSNAVGPHLGTAERQNA
ncbi:uncharacterized protein SPSK_08134 [Sporothrix schenckii 1099-18]|uniref:Uncharacterized protein n=1 Tax=Sporothrix schenckii 1099-18 TaxID=1397361 RepID=A0A0F2MG45_SPOSC|nr:uncharacterized protein SPSK_08134 [Sporothrix schenckii 1099-18]KJR88029.1 hypothetical protein SPSK_08134 [Sporothrix schenckii 1099-18]